MPSKIQEYNIWNEAKNCARHGKHHEAIALYQSVEGYFKQLNTHRPEKTERDNLFDQAMFFGDYLGALADGRNYTQAHEKGSFALLCIEKGNFTTLKYIYYNMGNLHLYQKEYTAAISWYEKAIATTKYFYKTVHYLINYGMALYFTGQKEQAEDIFLLAIKSSKDTKYNNAFEPYFYMEKLSLQKEDEKAAKKYRKMLRTRLQKYTVEEITFATSTMEDGEEIMKAYQSVTKKV